MGEENKLENPLLIQPLGSPISKEDSDLEASKAESPWLFAPLPIGKNENKPKPEPEVSPEETNRGLAKTAGTALSYVGNRPEDQKIRQARSTMVTAPSVLADYHAKNLSSLMDEAKMHEGNVSATKANFNDAVKEALRVGAIPEDPKAVEAMFGKKFNYPGMLSAGAEKNVEHNIQQRQGNYVQSGLEGVRDFKGESPLTAYQRVSRLLVPTDVSPTSILSQQQIDAQNALKLAHDTHQDALDTFATHKVTLDKANEDLKKATLNKIEGEAKFGGYEPQMAIKLLKGFAKAGGSALSGLSLYDAYDKLKKGDYTGLADLSMGAGGAMMLVPGLEPLGVATALPGAAYTGGKSALELFDRYARKKPTDIGNINIPSNP